jgi:hypothetical protein
MRGKICAERTQTKAHPHAHTMTQARRQTGSERCAYADVPDSHFIMMACCEDPLIAAAPLHAYRPVCDVSRHTHKRKENRERERERYRCELGRRPGGCSADGCPTSLQLRRISPRTRDRALYHQHSRNSKVHLYCSLYVRVDLHQARQRR